MTGNSWSRTSSSSAMMMVEEEAAWLFRQMSTFIFLINRDE
jgi:hypothetical protein